MKKIGVILSGCGVSDGAEIHESVLTLLAIDRAGAEAVCLAPNVEQSKVTDHWTKEERPERRNVLSESARIARGQIRDLAEVRGSELDAVIVPGGYGAVVNLCDFGTRGAECSVHPEVERLLNELFEQRKPIGALCIAPGLLARVFRNKGIRLKLTVGRDRETAALLETMGHEHVDCAVNEVLIDEDHKVLTTPAYMLARRVSEVAEGIDRLVRELMQRI